MATYALVLVLSSAVIHAGWNLATKRAHGGAAYVYLMATGSTIIWAPLGLWALFTGRAVAPGSSIPSALVAVLVSGAIHAAYFLCLQAGYNCGDLSLVYPLARGTGPLISTAVAIVLFGERPSVLALGGALLIGGGAFFLASDKPRRPCSYDPDSASISDRSDQSRAVMYGLLTGLLIAAYTLWDKHALSDVGMRPLFMDWATNLVRTVGMAPFFLLTAKHRAQLRTAVHTQLKPAIIVSIFAPLSYILVLTALAISPVSYVAPAREISILLGSLAGTHLLSEGDPASRRRRSLASVAMAAGVVALAIG